MSTPHTPSTGADPSDAPPGRWGRLPGSAPPGRYDIEATFPGDGNFAMQPELAEWTPGDGRCEPHVLRLADDSPLRDAGSDFDLDGSPTDIGALGGPGAPALEDTGDTDTDTDTDTDAPPDTDTAPIDAEWWLTGGACATAPSPGTSAFAVLFLMRYCRRRRRPTLSMSGRT